MRQSDSAPLGKSKRTNSLAFAQTDCHTCTSLDERCDRRRPQCSTCLGQSRKCGGFATPLSWDPKRMWSDGPSAATGDASNCLERRGSTAADPSPAGNLTNTNGRSGQTRPFRFVKGTPKPRKRRKVCSPVRKDAAEDQPETQGELSPSLSNSVSSAASDSVNDGQAGNCEGETGMPA